MQITDIKSSIYSMSLDKVGDIVQGINHVNQCIDIILKTRPGTDPLRPEFGCDVWSKIDQPIDKVKGEIINDVITAINSYLPEITVKKVNPVLDVSSVIVNIEWQFKTDSLIKEFQKTSVNYGK